VDEDMEIENTAEDSHLLVASRPKLPAYQVGITPKTCGA
jgi:hypothetical protein